jgi:catechol 2,3-dioxygenase-like lactoylglutathione lyase family enzyme
MKRTWTIIGVGDVPASFKWYQALFGQPATLPAHDYFGQILDSDGTVLLCLHEWGAHEHPSLMSPDHGTPGNGLLLFFRVDDFDLALQRARSLVTRLEHSNQAVLAPRSGRISRYDQCALCGVTRRCSCRALAGASWGSAALTSLPSPAGSCRLIAHSIRERIAEFGLF